MEIIYCNKDENAQLYVAKKLDSLAEVNISALLSKTELDYFNTVTAKRRQIEFVSVRKLLQQIIPNYSHKIEYTKTGKPLLADRSISISHCAKYIAIIISEFTDVAVDIEEYRTNIHTASKKFLHASEVNKYSSTEDLTLIWSAKEALYKMHGVSPDFKRDYYIKEISNDSILARVTTKNFDKATNLMYIRSKEYCLVWCSST